MNKVDLEEMVKEIIKEKKIYNEVSLQFELGQRLKKKYAGYCVEYERNIKFEPLRINPNKKLNKSEIDIVVYNDNERYAIELKYPAHRRYLNGEQYLNGEYPYRMKKFVDDIVFMDGVKKAGFTKTFCIVLVDDKLFYTDPGKRNSKNELYECFRGNKELHGIIKTPNAKNKYCVIDLRKITPQTINWQHINNEVAYYILEF